MGARARAVDTGAPAWADRRVGDGVPLALARAYDLRIARKWFMIILMHVTNALGPPINKLEGDSHATHLEASGT